MGSFFKGWRRKLGVVALAFACVFVAGWVRSFDKGESVWTDSSTVLSLKGGVYVETFVIPAPLSLDVHYRAAKNYRIMYDDPDIWYGRAFRFAVGGNADKKERVIRFYFPYWSLNLPLVLLSIWLLLSNSRLMPTQRVSHA